MPDFVPSTDAELVAYMAGYLTGYLSSASDDNEGLVLSNVYETIENHYNTYGRGPLVCHALPSTFEGYVTEDVPSSLQPLFEDLFNFENNRGLVFGDFIENPRGLNNLAQSEEYYYYLLRNTVYSRCCRYRYRMECLQGILPGIQ